jgi:UDP-glucose 4-epimerase
VWWVEVRCEIVHVDPREGDIDHSQADITKARKQLSYEPEYSIEDGLQAFLGERGDR